MFTIKMYSTHEMWTYVKLGLLLGDMVVVVLFWGGEVIPWLFHFV